MFPLQERRPRTPCAQSTARERGLSSPGDSIDKGVPGRGGSRGEETVAGEGRALFSFDPGCGRGGRYNNPVPTRKQNREFLPLAACPRLAENSRLGVPTSTQALYRGFEFAISNTYMRLQFRCSETVSGPVDAPNNGTNKSDQWPLNGNLLPLTPQRQDNVCTTGPLSGPMNSDPLILSCCQAHDNCYAAHGCNATSWIPNPLPWGACNTCNLKAAACIKNALPPIFIP